MVVLVEVEVQVVVEVMVEVEVLAVVMVEGEVLVVVMVVVGSSKVRKAFARGLHEGFRRLVTHQLPTVKSTTALSLHHTTHSPPFSPAINTC